MTTDEKAKKWLGKQLNGMPEDNPQYLILQRAIQAESSRSEVKEMIQEVFESFKTIPVDTPERIVALQRYETLLRIKRNITPIRRK